MGPHVSELTYSPTAYWCDFGLCGFGRCLKRGHDEHDIFGGGAARIGGMEGSSLEAAILLIFSSSA